MMLDDKIKCIMNDPLTVRAYYSNNDAVPASDTLQSLQLLSKGISDMKVESVWPTVMRNIPTLVHEIFDSITVDKM